MQCSVGTSLSHTHILYIFMLFFHFILHFSLFFCHSLSFTVLHWFNSALVILYFPVFIFTPFYLCSYHITLTLLAPCLCFLTFNSHIFSSSSSGWRVDSVGRGGELTDTEEGEWSSWHFNKGEGDPPFRCDPIRQLTTEGSQADR